MWFLGLAALGGVLMAKRADAKTPSTVNATGGNIPRYLTADQLIPYIERAKREVGLPYTNDAILAVCKVESGDYKKPNARFDRMAYRYEPHLGTASYGVMQVLETTARDRGLKGDPKQMYDPYVGVLFGCRQLKWTRDYLNSTIGKKNIKIGNRRANGITREATVSDVLMAYNGGVGTFLLNKSGTPATRQYVAKYETALSLANRGLA